MTELLHRWSGADVVDSYIGNCSNVPVEALEREMRSCR